MLIIRREQMEVFRRAAAQRFERELLGDLRRGYPERFHEMGEEGVLLLIRETEKRGAVHGIVAERDLATLAELDLVYGAPFERHKGCEWAGALLRDQSLTPSARLALILDRIPEPQT